MGGFHFRKSGVKLCQVLAKRLWVGGKLWGSIDTIETLDGKRITQVRKKTLLNKEDVPCSEVTALPFRTGCRFFRTPSTLSNLVSSPGWPKRRDATWTGSGKVNRRISFWNLSSSDSPVNGVGPCSRIEDVTKYQNALSKARLVSIFLSFALRTIFFLGTVVKP